MKALGLVVSEKKILLCFSHNAPGAGPVLTPGAWLAGFTLPVNCKQHISRFSATMANAKFSFLGETPRNKPGRQNRLREIPLCFSEKGNYLDLSIKVGFAEFLVGFLKMSTCMIIF